MKRIRHICILLWALAAAVALQSCAKNDEPLDTKEHLRLIPQYMKKKIVAHRGIWKAEGSAQNSKKSLELAGEYGLWGAETDVWETADGVLVLAHNKDIKGHEIPSSRWSDLQGIRLDNSESIPLLEDAMHIMRRFPDMNLMLEIKAANAIKIREILSQYDEDVRERILFKSFNRQICLELVEQELTPVYLLLNSIRTQDIEFVLDHNLAGVSVQEDFLGKNTDEIAALHAEGLKVFVWSPGTDDEIKFFINKGVDLVVADF